MMIIEQFGSHRETKRRFSLTLFDGDASVLVR
jgi:hypothetical protein